MTAWKKNEGIDFDFFNAHEFVQARDTSQPDTIRRSLRLRLANTKQVVFLGSRKGKSKAGDSKSFLFYEIEVISKLNLPVVVANLDGDREVDRDFIPQRFLDEDYYTESVSFQPKIIKYALEHYAAEYSASAKTGPHSYKAQAYTKLDL
nr:hypothetical protein [Amycolatopsis sp.]